MVNGEVGGCGEWGSGWVWWIGKWVGVWWMGKWVGVVDREVGGCVVDGEVGV